MKLDPTEYVQQARQEGRFSIGIPLRDVSFRTMTTVMERTIDDQPCSGFAADDCDWGEQDDGSGWHKPARSNFERHVNWSDEEQGDA